MTAHLSFEGLHVEFASDLLGAAGSAVFDAPPAVARYRYLLTRRWTTTTPAATVVGANPSKAGAALNDATVTRLCGFARRMGYGGLDLLNLCALISTDPKGLTTHPDPVGPRCDEVIDAFARHPGPVIAMWGAIGQVADRAREVTARLLAAGVPLLCFGTTKTGQPRHPLYLPSDTPLVPYRPELAS